MEKMTKVNSLLKLFKISQSTESRDNELSDFSTPKDLWKIVLLAIVIGLIAGVVALLLLDMIGLITHLAYYGDFGVSLVQPTTKYLGIYSVLIPIAGGLIIGAMAYWGSERIRGHGIPEAIETILINGSKIEPRLAILKPISSAVSIGSGGPFGAEGPIILTGGAIGSVLAQFFKLSAIQRRTLLVAGACAGMAAVFGTPVAATLFGVELFVFEWKPRTVVPISIAVVTASVLRNIFAAHSLLLPAPLFPVPQHVTFSSLGVAGAVPIGVACALLAWVLSNAVYKFEDLFRRLPIHWAWWPAMGGLVIGLGGLVNPRALGVGYASIGAELAGKIAIGGLISLLLVKLVIWSFSLGSGTSGGVLAPLLIMGAALGGIMAPIMPGGTEATWALLGLAATLSASIRSPFTSVIFAFELTRDTGSLLPLLLACFVSYVVSTRILKRSILTEKIARRGFHISCEYAVEPLETLLVKEVLKRDIVTITTDQKVIDIRTCVETSIGIRRQRIFPIVSELHELLGIVTRTDLFMAKIDNGEDLRALEIMRPSPIVAYLDETLRSTADRMAEFEVGAVPVVVSSSNPEVVGVITEFDILRSRQRQLVEERHREKILGVSSYGQNDDI